MQADLLLNIQSKLGEGPLWDERENILYWVDILGCALHRYNPATGNNDTFDVG
ncbi:MAG: SMP-30/gluconolactonase/LRE family protein, partial [Chloroflexota bacterium]